MTGQIPNQNRAWRKILNLLIYSGVTDRRLSQRCWWRLTSSEMLTQCRLVNNYRRFERSKSLHLQAPALLFFLDCMTLNMLALQPFEISVTICQSTSQKNWYLSRGIEKSAANVIVSTIWSLGFHVQDCHRDCVTWQVTVFNAPYISHGVTTR